MNFKYFLETKTAPGAILKVMVPARNYCKTDHACEFLDEFELLRLYVFDFQITAHDYPAGYDAIIWLSQDKPIF